MLFIMFIRCYCFFILAHWCHGCVSYELDAGSPNNTNSSIMSSLCDQLWVYFVKPFKVWSDKSTSSTEMTRNTDDTRRIRYILVSSFIISNLQNSLWVTNIKSLQNSFTLLECWSSSPVCWIVINIKNELFNKLCRVLGSIWNWHVSHYYMHLMCQLYPFVWYYFFLSWIASLLNRCPMYKENTFGKSDHFRFHFQELALIEFLYELLLFVRINLYSNSYFFSRILR